MGLLPSRSILAHRCTGSGERDGEAMAQATYGIKINEASVYGARFAAKKRGGHVFECL